MLFSVKSVATVFSNMRASLFVLKIIHRTTAAQAPRVPGGNEILK